MCKAVCVHTHMRKRPVKNRGLKLKALYDY